VRIKLRNEIHYEPTDDEIQEYLKGEKEDELSIREVSAAFRMGEEVRSKHTSFHTSQRIVTYAENAS
jgi:hypothetical protein